MLFTAGVFSILIVAQAPPAALHVGATVAPACRISLQAPAGPGGPGSPGSPGSNDESPAYILSCGASHLRTLRVTTSRGDQIVAVPRTDAPQRVAGGTVAFVIGRPGAAAASLHGAAARGLRPSEPLTVTFDF